MLRLGFKIFGITVGSDLVLRLVLGLGLGLMLG